jgi:UDP-N-acetylmuramate: L-alanyl-gamma-D-glutamyl-meso-diaminopimelate ligase
MRVHFIAIGGSAMHNLAIALRQKGYIVSGSDDEIFEPSRSRLAAQGILPQAIGWFPERISKDLDAVILGMHARADNPELIKAQELGLKIYSYPAFLYQQSAEKKRVVIGGSHGKTTITAMVLHVLARAGIETDYMVGAQLEGFDVMVRLSDTAQWMVMEGDEYLTSPIDRRPKFLLYKPHIAVISGIAWDHINVFPQFEEYVRQFHLFADSVEAGGHLIYFEEDENVCHVATQFKGSAEGYKAHPHELIGDKANLVLPDGNRLPLQVFGSHNMANLNAARLVCKRMGVGDNEFYKAIGSFGGASRRLEFVGERQGMKIYRDFAHAPSKVGASVGALREQFPDRFITACLELHTFSSLNENFIHLYKGSLDAADLAIVFFDPHAVALKRLPQLTHKQIQAAFAHPDLHIFSDAKKLEAFLQARRRSHAVLALMSSGSFKGLELEGL